MELTCLRHIFLHVALKFVSFLRAYRAIALYSWCWRDIKFMATLAIDCLVVMPTLERFIPHVICFGANE